MLTTINDKVRYLNKNNNANERENYSKWWKELIEHYGTSITYYTHGYSLTSHNFLYGEDPTASYTKTPNVIMITDITNDALMLSKFGIMADCDLTAVIHISSFYEKLGCGSEPKAGDLIQLTEYGADRPGGRSAPIYEITERDDEYLNMTNPLIGHYVWYIKCKRFEYSYEPGIPDQPNNKQLSDGGDYGRYAGGENPEELFQSYPDSVQNSAKCIYDYYSDDPTGLEINPNHFVPPAKPSCPENLTLRNLSAVPGPYAQQEVFTQEHLDSINALTTELLSSNAVNTATTEQIFITNNRKNVMLRTLVSDVSGTKTFTIQTSGKPEDVITYSTSDSVVNLFDVFGGGTV